MLRKKRMLKALAVFCMAAAPAMAQLAIDSDALATLKKNDVMSRTSLQLQKPAVKKGQQFVRLDDMLQKAQRTTTPETRALKPVAYYEVESGVYTLVPGMSLPTEGTYTDNGYLVPLNTPVKYSYVHTGTGGVPAHYEWMLSDNDVVIGTPSAEYSYYPYMFLSSPTTITPDLYVINENSVDDSYSAGTLKFTMSDGSEQEVRGMIPLYGAGWVYNMDVDAYPGLSSSLLYADDSDIWGTIFLGTDTEYHSAYVEYFDAPKGGYAGVQGSWIPVITPTDVDLTAKTFNLAYAELVDSVLTVKKEVAVTGDKIMKVGTSAESGVTEWVVFGILDSMLLVQNNWAVIIEGPQDGTKWAMKCQNDRLYDGNPLNDEKTTTMQLLMSGDYAGYMTNAVSYSNSAGEMKAYPISLDIYNYVALPWMSIVATVDEGSILLGDSIAAAAEGGTAPAQLVSWNVVSSIKVTSDASWLSCTTSPFTTDDGQVAEILLNIAITTEPLPEGVGGRYAHLTFTDETGYAKVFTVIQGDYAAGIKDIVIDVDGQADPNAPIYDLMGRRVTNPVKGIYIQNGKKIIID